MGFPYGTWHLTTTCYINKHTLCLSQTHNSHEHTRLSHPLEWSIMECRLKCIWCMNPATVAIHTDNCTFAALGFHKQITTCLDCTLWQWWWWHLHWHKDMLNFSTLNNSHVFTPTCNHTSSLSQSANIKNLLECELWPEGTTVHSSVQVNADVYTFTVHANKQVCIDCSCGNGVQLNVSSTKRHSQMANLIITNTVYINRHLAYTCVNSFFTVYYITKPLHLVQWHIGIPFAWKLLW